MAVSFKGAHFPKDLILMGVRWSVAYPLSYRHIEGLMEERGVEVDHSTLQRWVVKYGPDRGAGSSRSQTDHATAVGVQIVRCSPRHTRWE
jgi:transposase-like protein